MAEHQQSERARIIARSAQTDDHERSPHGQAGENPLSRLQGLVGNAQVARMLAGGAALFVACNRARAAPIVHTMRNSLLMFEQCT